MPSFFSLFHDVDGREYESRFQWFVVSRDAEYGLYRVRETEVERLVRLVQEQPSSRTPLISLARFLGISLEPEAYRLFIEDIGLPTAMVIFFEEREEMSDGPLDYQGITDAHYQKYCAFKFASFLDLLRPGSIRWRGEAQLDCVPYVFRGLSLFQATVEVENRASMLSVWIRRPGPLAFSKKNAKQSQDVNARRALLLTLENLTAPEVARRLDREGFKPHKYPSYTAWFRTKRESFESWLSRERARNQNA